MAKITVNILRKLDNSINTERITKAAAKTALNDCVDDLVRASSGAAPHDTGYLDTKGWSKSVKAEGSGFVGTVSYSAKENGYDYAIRMHEDTYNLGPGSRAKGGGTGMSGANYPVGNKYLTRPFEGESETYKKHIADMIRKAIGR